jgi:hypothetical protein
MDYKVIRENLNKDLAQSVNQMRQMQAAITNLQVQIHRQEGALLFLDSLEKGDEETNPITPAPVNPFDSLPDDDSASTVGTGAVAVEPPRPAKQPTGIFGPE